MSEKASTFIWNVLMEGGGAQFQQFCNSGNPPYHTFLIYTDSWYTPHVSSMLFSPPPSFQSFCSTFRWWKLKTCGYNFYEKFHFESLLNFNFIAMRKTEETKDLSHPLTQKPLVKTFNKCKFSAASCWKSWPLDWVSFICF